VPPCSPVPFQLQSEGPFLKLDDLYSVSSEAFLKTYRA